MKKIILTFISIAAVFGCSSGSGNEEITLVDQVTDSEQIFTIEDFKQIGFKQSKKYKVTGLDIGYFDDCYFKYSKNIIDYYKLDIRDVDEKFISNYDVVINLAGLSLFLINPLKDIDEEEAYKITENFTKNLAFICKKNGIKFIFPSSCSVYGRTIDTIFNE